MQLCEKRIKEHTAELARKQIVEASEKALEERSQDLVNKKAELDSIIAETKGRAELTTESIKLLK